MPASWLENELARHLSVSACTDDEIRNIRKVFLSQSLFPDVGRIRRTYKGYAYVASDTGYIIRILPYKDSDSELLFCTRVDVQGHGYGGGRTNAPTPSVPMMTAIKPSRWLCTLHYSTIPYDVGDVAFVDGFSGEIRGAVPTGPAGETARFCSKVVREGRDYIVPPIGQVYLDNAGGQRTQVSMPVPVMLPYSELDIIWWQVPIAAYPKRAIDRCQGRVNSTTFYAPYRPDQIVTYAPETVLFLAARPQEIRFPDGSFGYNVHYFFKRRGDDYAGDGDARGLSWNSLPDSRNRWRAAYRSKLGTEKLYPTADLNKLFQSGAIP